MNGDAVSAFIAEFRAELQRLNHQAATQRKVLETKQARAEEGITRIINAIKAGFMAESLQAELARLEEEKKAVARDLSDLEPEFVVPDEDITAVYKGKVTALIESLNLDVQSRSAAAIALADLIDCVTVSWDQDAWEHTIEIEGDIVALLIAGGENSKNAASIARSACSLKLVAGA